MFTRGTRFPLPRSSEVPGPNAYDIHDVEYDAYKRGAFLETADRFAETKPSDVSRAGGRTTPGPAKLTNGAKPTKASVKSTSTDRYAALQHKVEELERIHRDGKKSHQVEVEKLRQELSRARKANTEQTERYDKLKKQSELLGSRVQELKKLHEGGQAELKDLRLKLRFAEHERTQLASKQGEIGDAKKALYVLDSNRRDELRERDKKIAELERTRAAEKEKRELLEVNFSEVKEGVKSEALEAKTHASDLEKKLQEANSKASRTMASYNALQQRADETEQNLLNQLEQHRQLISRVAVEYGRLASSSVPKTQHDRVKVELASTQLRLCRSDRKLANSEAQVQDLAQLIRQNRAENALLQEHLRDAESTVTSYAASLKNVLNDVVSDTSVDQNLRDDFAAVRQEQAASDVAKEQVLTSNESIWIDFYKQRLDVLLLHSASLLKHLEERDKLLLQKSSENTTMEAKHSNLLESLSGLRLEHDTLQTQLSDTVANLDETLKRLEVAKQEHLDLETHLKSKVVEAERSLTQEKEANKRLANIVQKGKQAEDALREELDELTCSLAEAEQYQEAYIDLLTEMEGLVQRNALAEEETQRLSRFNAEIIGHKNPAQRVVYLDRIRRELHDTKQKLLATQRDRDTVQFKNDDLRHELQLYKSVAVPNEYKPRGHVTRVVRVPLGDQNLNARSTNDEEDVCGYPQGTQHSGDLTLEEIM